MQFQVAARKEDVMIFLEWVLDNYKIKKFSSLRENWRLWCQLYRKAVGRSLHAKCYQDINYVSGTHSPLFPNTNKRAKYMKGNLVSCYDLDMFVGDKPVYILFFVTTGRKIQHPTMMVAK